MLAQIVVQAAETKNVVAMCCGSELLRTMLPHLLEQLEMCQKSLSAYLETKRAEFPRCALQKNAWEFRPCFTNLVHCGDHYMHLKATDFDCLSAWHGDFPEGLYN